jgi:hypothetical protein
VILDWWRAPVVLVFVPNVNRVLIASSFRNAKKFAEKYGDSVGIFDLRDLIPNRAKSPVPYYCASDYMYNRMVDEHLKALAFGCWGGCGRTMTVLSVLLSKLTRDRDMAFPLFLFAVKQRRKACPEIREQYEIVARELSLGDADIARRVVRYPEVAYYLFKNRGFEYMWNVFRSEEDVRKLADGNRPELGLLDLDADLNKGQALAFLSKQ